ncbi:MAG: TrkH family potassium uptake protein [Candidatus Omnitrophota bacterium]|nr:TrkH family potassium uptake protein [Candidatus Omnitrophota bacterium]MDZ4242181.1 TrkH family potassium uptake protein [Candidatus Omnitrophota bacterium]
MLLKPDVVKDVKIVGFYLGRVISGISVFMAVPLALSLSLGETDPAADFIIGILSCLFFGLLMYILCYTKQEPRWIHGMMVVALSWLAAAGFSAVPLFLSGHFASFLDAYFEAMSGITTSGLSLANDLSHMSYGHNLWRHLIMFMGGQGMVVVVLSFFLFGSAGGFRLYVGEGRDERVMPNIRQTSRAIWTISMVFLVLGTALLAAIAFQDGMSFKNALFHGACIFMAAFDTGGFSPHHQSIVYYHSWTFELATILIMVLGAINFRVHYVVWMGKRAEIWNNVELRALLTTILGAYFLVALGLTFHWQVYPDAVSLFRRGFYQLISAHTGTGFQTIYSDQFLGEWDQLSLFALIVAMVLGGAICSTTGGIKMIRLAIIVQAFALEIKHFIATEASVFFKKVHHIKTVILNEKQMLSSCLILLAYVVTVFIGSMVGMMCGYPFLDSLFESASATGNVGLSCGITAVTMPWVLKISYIVQMWAGRLEFMSVFAVLGFVFALFRGR